MEITEVIRHGIITEKSVALQQYTRPQYTFRVATQANKYEIRTAVETMFPGVKVVAVRTMRMPGKAKTMRTRKGIYTSEARPWKKAIVTLAEGQTIAEMQA